MTCCRNVRNSLISKRNIPKMSACAYFVIILCLAVNTDTKLVKRTEGEISDGERNILEREPVDETISDGNVIAANADPSAPTGLTVTSVSNTSISLKWDKPRTSMGHILKYRISWRSSTSDDEQDTENDNTFFTVDGLTPHKDYTFKVQAITTVGPGEWSEQVSATTDVGVPSAPRELSFTWIGNTTIGLKWEAPLAPSGPILRYRVHWKNFSSADEKDTSGNIASLRLDGLTPYTNYTFKVLAITVAGPGEWSEEKMVMTDVGVPHAPVRLTVTTITNTTVGLQWEEPEISTGPILRYRIRWNYTNTGGELLTQTSNTSITIDLLTPDVLYTFKVMAITEAGQGQWSKSVKAQTKGKLGDSCAWNPCKNGGTCKIENGTVTCFCKAPYTGKFCDTNSKSGLNTYIIIFAAVGTILLIILITVCGIACRRSQGSETV